MVVVVVMMMMVVVVVMLMMMMMMMMLMTLMTIVTRPQDDDDGWCSSHAMPDSNLDAPMSIISPQCPQTALTAPSHFSTTLFQLFVV